MPTLTLRRLFLPSTIAAVLLTAALVLIPAPTASAHDSLTSSDPAADSTVETLPQTMTLTFSASLFDSAEATAVVVTDAAGTVVSTGAPTIDGAMVTQDLATDTAIAGAYRVQWQVVSSDGHPIEGDFGFAVSTATAPTATPTPAPVVTEPSAKAEESTTPPADGPDMQSTSSVSTPWIIAGTGAVLILVFLLIVWRSRRRRSGGEPDSTAPVER